VRELINLEDLKTEVKKKNNKKKGKKGAKVQQE
jgi:hypothetical protein